MKTSLQITEPTSLIEAHANLAYYKGLVEHPLDPDAPDNEYAAYVKLVEAIIDLNLHPIASSSDIQKLEAVADRIANKLKRSERIKRRADYVKAHPTPIAEMILSDDEAHEIVAADVVADELVGVDG